MSYDINKFKKILINTEEWLKKELSGVRTGQASPALLDTIKVESYGTLIPISQIASIVAEGARSLRIAPWDMSTAKEIEKSIIQSSLGLSVSMDDKGLRINFPELTSERRVQIAKTVKEKLEEARKQVRMHRDEAIKDLKAKEKAGGMGEDEYFRHEKEIQKSVDEQNKKLDEIYSKKEKEILA